MELFSATQPLVEFLQRWGEMSPFAAAMLALVFVAGGIMPVPRVLLTIASGVVFGMSAVPIILPSTTIGAIIGFLLARYLFAERLWRRIAHKPRLIAIMNAVNAEGWRIVGLIRIASPIPSTVANALFGLTRIGLLPYSWATFVFIIPQTLLYAYLGSVGKVALVDQTESGLHLGIMAAGGLAFLAVVLLISRRVRASLREFEQQSSVGAAS
jgi:uncharacterized membrane protein YdjX (TVP38/TMEM64 family)